MPRSSASKKSVVAGERDRPDVARRRAQWIKYQDRVEPERLVFIDETWTRTDMAALRGWAPCGQRLPTKVPHGRWKNMTFLSALSASRLLLLLTHNPTPPHHTRQAIVSPKTQKLFPPKSCRPNHRRCL